MHDPIVIRRRFRGPPESGNGGYSCGILGVRFDEPVEVMLRVPPPLETSLAVEARPGGGLAATHEGAVVIEAHPVTFEDPTPEGVSLRDAERAAASFEGFTNHAFPGCFVCGPEREIGDGLRIFPGSLAGGIAAAPWTPDASVGSSEGTVLPEVVWAALDCPTGWATYYAAAEGEISLLGRMSARILRPIRVGETYIAAGWAAGRDGRKHFATSAILSAAGEPHAWSHATWVELKA